MKIDMTTHKQMNRPPINVRLNGMDVRECISADEEKGEVFYHDTPAKLQYNDIGGLDLVVHRKTGKVEIILGDDVRMGQ